MSLQDAIATLGTETAIPQDAGTIIPVSISGPVKSNMIALASRLSADAEFNRLLKKTLDASEYVRQGPINVLFTLRALLGTDGMAKMPDPRKDKDESNNPAIYETSKQNKDGEWTSGTENAYRDFIEHLPEGERLRAITDACKAANDVKAKADAPMPYRVWPGSRITAEYKNTDRRRSAFLSLVEEAVMLEKKLLAGNDLPHVDFEFIYDEIAGENGEPSTKEVARVAQPILCGSTKAGERNKTRNLSVKQFLGLDLEAAKANGGDFEAVLNTLKKGTNQEGNNEEEGEDDEAAMLDTKTTEPTLAMVVHALEDDGIVAALWKRLASKNPKDSDDLAMTLFDLHNATKPFYDKLAKRVQALNVQANEADKAKAV